MRLNSLWAALAVALLTAPLSGAAEQKVFRIGIIGLDTSHVTAFTQAINNPAKNYGCKVVAGYPGGSPDIDSSRNRVKGYTEELRDKYGVEIVDSIEELCKKVDGVLLESVDGRPHLAQARQVIAARKPLFIDKPLAASLEDAREIARLAKEAGVPWFSTSSLRYGETAVSMKFPDTTGVTTWGPGPLEEHHYLDLSWYAIHPIEMLYALLGPGCEEVTRISTAGADVVVGRWKGGKIGSVRALRPSGGDGALVFRPKEVLQSDPKAKAGYGPMLKEIAKFFQTGIPPVPNEETLELFAFMDAAQRSKAAGGQPMRLR